MKKLLFLLLLITASCTPVVAQALPVFNQTSDAKDWLYTIKDPNIILDYLVRASKIENMKPVVTFPTANFLLMKDRSLYVSYSSPFVVKLGGDLMTVEVKPANVTVPGFSPVPMDLTWKDSLVMTGTVGALALAVGLVVGVFVVKR